MDRIVVIENFLTKKECEDALPLIIKGDVLDSGIIYDRLTKYVSDFITLKGYRLSNISPFKFNVHTSENSNPEWVSDEETYISFLIQLNEDYFRGRFQFLIDDNDKYFQLPHGAGNLVVYFSNIKNRTTPVENGMKYTIASSVNIIKEEDFKKTLI